MDGVGGSQREKNAASHAKADFKISFISLFYTFYLQIR
jgi:hypothetical protein